MVRYSGGTLRWGCSAGSSAFAEAPAEGPALHSQSEWTTGLQLERQPVRHDLRAGIAFERQHSSIDRRKRANGAVSIERLQ